MRWNLNAHPGDSRYKVLSDFREYRLPAGPVIGGDEPGDSPKIRSTGTSNRLAPGPVCEVRRKPVDRVEGEVLVDAVHSRGFL